MDPNDLLIFKLRGIHAAAKAVKPQPTPVAPPVPPPAAVLPPAPAIPAPLEVKAEPRQKPAEEKATKQTKTAEPEEQVVIKPEEELTSEESGELYGYSPEVREEARPKVGGSSIISGPPITNIFSAATGVLFLLNAVVFGYFVYPQSSFILGYIARVGVNGFIASSNYNYYMSFANLVLVVLSFVGGLLMFTKIERSHLVSGLVSALIILTVTFEYLSSSTTYLLVVSVIAFASIGTLAYERMTMASAQAEREELAPEEINWPRIETF